MKTKVLYIPDQKSASFDQRIVDFFRGVCDWDVQIFDEPLSRINVVRANEIISKEFEMVVGVGTGALMAEFIEYDCSKILIDPLRFSDWIWENKKNWNDEFHADADCLRERRSNIDPRNEKIYRYFTPYNNYVVETIGNYIMIQNRPCVRTNEGGIVFDGRWFEDSLVEIMNCLGYHIKPIGDI